MSKETAPGGEAVSSEAAVEDKGDKEEAAALEAQAEQSTAHAIYGKTYAMTGGPILTGEEDETCVLQVRAKLFKLVTKVPEKSVNDDDGGDEGNETNLNLKNMSKGSPEKEWSEVGVGPLRVLRSKKSTCDTSISKEARIVMRREDKRGGTGTKVLLNTKIKAHSSAVLQGERSLCFSTFVPSTDEPVSRSGSNSDGNHTVVPVSYMLRCKLPSEISDLYKIVDVAITQAKGDSRNTQSTCKSE